MKRICCTDLWTAILEGRMEWTSDAAGPIVAGWWTRSWVSAEEFILSDIGFVPAMRCPYCDAEI